MIDDFQTLVYCDFKISSCAPSTTGGEHPISKTFYHLLEKIASTDAIKFNSIYNKSPSCIYKSFRFKKSVQKKPSKSPRTLEKSCFYGRCVMKVKR